MSLATNEKRSSSHGTSKGFKDWANVILTAETYFFRSVWRFKTPHGVLSIHPPIT